MPRETPPERRNGPEKNPRATTSTPPSATRQSSGSPWPCCRAESPRVEKRLDGWLAALEHLAAAGLPTTGAPDWVLRALAARGGRDRAIAELVHTAQCENLR